MAVDGWEVVSTTAACIAAVAALVALWFAKRTVQDAAAARADERRQRAADERERLRLRLRLLADLITEIRESAEFELTGTHDRPQASTSWRVNADRLSWESLGLGLPTCMNLWLAKGPVDVIAQAGKARGEVDNAVFHLHQQIEIEEA